MEVVRIRASNCPYCGAPLSTPERCDRCANTFLVHKEDPELLARAESRRVQNFYRRAIVSLALVLVLPILYLPAYLTPTARVALAFLVMPLLVGAICGGLSLDFLPLAAGKNDKAELRTAFITWTQQQRFGWFAVKPLIALTLLWNFNVRNAHAYAAAGLFLGELAALVLLYLVGI